MMPRAHLRCLTCGSSNIIIEDELYCEDLLVCVDCGTVVSDAALVSQRVSVGASDVSSNQTTAEAKEPRWDLMKGIQRVDALCGILRVNHEIQELSQSYYSKAYQHKSFRRGSLRKKENLAGCCLLVNCRLLNWPISMATISCLLDADPIVMVKLYLEMIKILNVEVHEELSERQKDLTERAQVSSTSSTSSFELAEDTWVVTCCEDLPTEEAAAPQISQLVDQNPKASSVEQCELNAEQTQRPGDGDNHQVAQLHGDTPKSQDPAPNGRKRALCGPKAKRRRVASSRMLMKMKTSLTVKLTLTSALLRKRLLGHIRCFLMTNYYHNPSRPDYSDMLFSLDLVCDKRC